MKLEDLRKALREKRRGVRKVSLPFAGCAVCGDERAGRNRMFCIKCNKPLCLDCSCTCETPLGLPVIGKDDIHAPTVIKGKRIDMVVMDDVIDAGPSGDDRLDAMALAFDSLKSDKCTACKKYLAEKGKSLCKKCRTKSAFAEMLRKHLASGREEK